MITEKDRLRKREFSLRRRLSDIVIEIFWAKHEVAKLVDRQTKLQQEQYKADYALAMIDGRYHVIKAEGTKKKKELGVEELMLTLSKEQLKNVLNVLEED